MRPNLTGTTAIGTGAHAFGATARPRAIASIAGSQALKLDDFFSATRRFLEFNFEVITQILAPAATRTRTSTPGSEEISEDVGENFLEALAEIEPAETTGRLLTLKCGMSEAVVLAALLRIRENLVGFVYFLEFLFGLFIARITIGMKLNRQAPVSFLNFLVTGAPADT